MKILIKFKVYFLLGGLLSFSPYGWSQQADTLHYSGKAKAQSRGPARKELFKNAIEFHTLKFVSETIGKDKAQKNKSQIKNKVLKHSGKYILSIKGSSLKKGEDEFYTSNITLKISYNNLKKILLEEGLLYQTEGPPRVLPIIRIVDKVHSTSYTWWAHSPTPQNKLFQNLLTQIHRGLTQKLFLQGFYGIEPLKWPLAPLIPRAFALETLRKQDVLHLAQYMRSSIVLLGEIIIKPMPQWTGTFQLDLRIMGLRSSNGRIVGEVVRNYKTDSGPFEYVVQKKVSEILGSVTSGISQQLLESWRKGTFDANLYTLTLNGSFNYNQYMELKEKLVSNVREIKVLRERMFETNKLSFEMDVSVLPEVLAKKLTQLKLGPYKFEVDSIKDQNLALNVVIQDKFRKKQPN